MRHVSSTSSSSAPPAAVISRMQRSGSCSSWIAATAQRPVRVATLASSSSSSSADSLGDALGLGALAAVVVQQRLRPQRGVEHAAHALQAGALLGDLDVGERVVEASRCCWSCARVIASWPSRPSWRVARATDSARSSVA